MKSQRQKSAGALAIGTILVFLVACGPDGASHETAPPQDRYLYVALDGSIDGDGTTDNPFSYPVKTIGLALLEGYRGVKIAEGDYLHFLTGPRWNLYGGIDVIGGCDRTTWEPVAGHYATISANNLPGEGLGIRVPTLVRGMEFIGNRTSANNPTSMAVYLEGCTADLRFEQCRFVTLGGENGPPAWGPTELPSEPEPPQAGQAGSCDSSLTVLGGGSGGNGYSGGPGGPGGLPQSAGGDGQTGDHANIEPVPVGGSGGLPGQAGEPGVDGLDGSDGAGGLARPGLGEFTHHTIRPNDGNRGGGGTSGNGGGGGGGGGGSATGTGNGGGGGGTGGHGGTGASAGQGGGHSIGVLAVNSAAVFRACVFVTAAAGLGSDGAEGVLGAAGTLGAAGGNTCVPEVGQGGHGGHGGAGGASGGGAGGNGGSCFGLIELGNGQCDVDSTCTFDNGLPGTPGLGGQHGRTLIRAESGCEGLSIGHLVLLPINNNLLPTSDLNVGGPRLEDRADKPDRKHSAAL